MYRPLLGLGATVGPDPNGCGYGQANVEPAGLSATYRRYYPVGSSTAKLCGASAASAAPATAAACNLSANPGFCALAKTSGSAFLGRGTKADVDAWRAWAPTGVSAEAIDGGAGTPASDALFYGGLVLASIAVLGGVWWATTH